MCLAILLKRKPTIKAMLATTITILIINSVDNGDIVLAPGDMFVKM